eukprot:gene9421-11085_t
MAVALSTERTLLLEKLAEFGRNGALSLLMSLSDSLHNSAVGDKSCKIPFETSSSVLQQCIRVLKNNNDSSQKGSVWDLLFFMCERQFNSLSSELLSAVETSDVLSFVLQSITSLSAENDFEARGCLQFVVCFGKSAEHRVAMIGQTDGIMESVLHALDTKFDPLNVEVKGLLLLALSVIVYADLYEEFLRKDGFRIVNEVFHGMHTQQLYLKASRTTAFDWMEVGMLNRCLSALYGMFSACMEVASTATKLPKTMFSYEPAALIQTTSALHEFFTLSDDPTFVEYITMSISCYLLFVEKVHPGSLKFVLLYRGKKLSPTTYSGKPMIIHAILITRDPQYQHLAKPVQDCLLRYSNVFPSVDRMIADYLSKEPAVAPASGPLAKLCAFPDCYVSSVGGSRHLKQCGRCRAVYYCTDEHQKEHWAEHKLECVRKT